MKIINFKQVFSYFNPHNDNNRTHREAEQCETAVEKEDNLDLPVLPFPQTTSIPEITFKNKADKKFTDPKVEHEENFYDAIEISKSVDDVRFSDMAKKVELESVNHLKYSKIVF